MSNCCGTKSIVDGRDVVYTGPTLLCTNIVKGDRIDTILKNIDSMLCSIVDSNIILSGDINGEGITSIETSLAVTGVAAGTYVKPTLSVDTKGRITTITSAAASSDLVYTTSDFSTATDCIDGQLDARTYRVIWRGVGKLIPFTEWETITGGGFRILLPGFDVTDDVNNVFFVEFY